MPNQVFQNGDDRRVVDQAEVQRLSDRLVKVGKLFEPDASWIMDAGLVLGEIAGKHMSSLAVPLKLTSGLAPQPAAPIDQIEAVSTRHSASASAAVEIIRSVAKVFTETERELTKQDYRHYGMLLEEALRMLGVKP